MMKKLFGIMLDFPTYFSEKSPTNLKFFFRKKSSLIRNFPLKNLVECFLKADNFSFKPMLGEIYNTSDFIIEIVSKKKSNVFTNVGFFLRIQKIIKFRKYLDFEYSSSLNNCFLKSKQEKINKERRRKEEVLFPIDIIPPCFLKNAPKKIPFSFNIYSFYKKNQKSFFFKKNPEKTTDHVLSMDKRSILKKKRINNFFVDFQGDISPNFPLKKKKKNLFFIPLYGIGFFSRLFKKRPIWNRKTIENFLPHSLKKYLIKILPVISYRFSGVNPFKKSWIRMGFDPRKIKKSVIYQSLVRKINKNRKEKFSFFRKKSQEKNLKKRLRKPMNNLSYNSSKRLHNLFKISNSSLSQLCDIYSEKFKKFFEKIPKKKIFINYLLGWLSLDEFKKLNYFSKF